MGVLADFLGLRGCTRFCAGHELESVGAGELDSSAKGVTLIR